MDAPRNRLINRIDKVLAAAPRVDLAALRAGVARSRRMEGFAPPSRVLRALFRQLPDCEMIDKETVVARRPGDAAEILSENEQTILAVFRKHGPLMTYPDALKRCIAAGVNEHTATIYLGDCAVVRRVALGVYITMGEMAHPSEVEALSRTIRRGRRGRVMQDNGWNSAGTALWATYKISSGLLRNGVVGIPVGIKKLLPEAGYDVLGPSANILGRLVVKESSAWGLLPLFRRKGGEVGDFMRITFTLSNKTAKVELSQEPFEDA